MNLAVKNWESVRINIGKQGTTLLDVTVKQVELLFIEGAENPADLFTKNLGHIKFTKFREQLGLEPYLAVIQLPITQSLT